MDLPSPNQPQSGKKQVRNLLLVLMSSVLLSIAVVATIAYQYGPSGKYRAQSILLSGETLSHLTTTISTGGAEGQPLYHLDHIEFLYLHPLGKGWELYGVELPAYNTFFTMLQGEEGSPALTEELGDLFTKGGYSRLVLYLRPASSLEGPKKAISFQEVQFSVARPEVYRIQLHQPDTSAEGTPIHWVYFEKSGLWSKVKALFVEKTP